MAYETEGTRLKQIETEIATKLAQRNALQNELRALDSEKREIEATIVAETKTAAPEPV